MRKILFFLVLTLMIVCLAFTMIKGIKMNKIEVLGIKDIIKKDEQIDQKNDELTKLVKISYANANQELNKSAETLEATKKEYEDQAILLADNKYYGQTEKYELEFLYTKAGNYARENGVEVKLEFKNSTTAGLYDMYFTVTGEYVDVTQYIYDIENDSKLGFKIENFSMDTNMDRDNKLKNDDNNKVTGKFSCKEIRIDLKNLDSSGKTEQSTETTQGQTPETTQGQTPETTQGQTPETTQGQATENNSEKAKDSNANNANAQNRNEAKQSEIKSDTEEMLESMAN